MTLSGKTAVVTGGGSGIGLACAEALARQAARVMIAGRRAELLRAAAAAYDGPGELLWHVVDVADRDSVADLFRFAAEKLGAVDILINAAGINIRNRSMAAMSPEQWDEVLAINATGTYNCIQAVLPDMRRRRDGLI